MDADQAIREASKIRLSFDVLPQLQANFAFTKAYVAESDGTQGGLKGARCFVDLALFHDPLPAWLDVGKHICWENDRLGLKATFAPLQAILTERHASGGPVGVRDGLEVAQQLAGNTDVLKALRGFTTT